MRFVSESVFCSGFTGRSSVTKNIDSRLSEINTINKLQKRDRWVNRLHPLVKLFITVLYLALVMSLDKYDLARAISFAVFPFVFYNMADLRLKTALYRMRFILPLVLAVGILNPFFDKSVIWKIGEFEITGGIVSMTTLLLKGFYAVLTAYALIAVTSIENICYALRCIKVPKVIVKVILLIYRYLFVLAEEAGRISDAYSLRAPSQRGLSYKAWGPVVGRWLLRSMDKAQRVYESMCLRGFSGDFAFSGGHKAKAADFIFLLVWTGVLLILRFTDVINSIGKLLLR